MLTRLVTTLTCIIACCFIAFGQRTTRQGLKPMAHTDEALAPTRHDTISIDSTHVRLSGYEKTLRSAVESVFITNLSELPIMGVILDIEYFDMKGRQLHMRQVPVDAAVPPGETRMGRFSSWDKQKVWYYYLSDPVRTRLQSTPYKVIIKPVRAVVSHSFECSDSIHE